jgi:hypothetical protein
MYFDTLISDTSSRFIVRRDQVPSLDNVNFKHLIWICVFFMA